MRPKSIIQFEWIYLASAAIGVLSTYLTADANAAQMANSGIAFTPSTIIVVTWITTAIGVGLALLASRKASNVARWIVIVLSALGIVSFPFLVPALPAMGPIAILTVSQFVLSIVMIWLLLRPDAKAWFADGRG